MIGLKELVARGRSSGGEEMEGSDVTERRGVFFFFLRFSEGTTSTDAASKAKTGLSDSREMAPLEVSDFI